MVKILIPTDFTDAAIKAASFADYLFPHKDIEIFLLNVYEMVHSSSEMIISIDDILKQKSEAELEKEKEKFELKFPKLHGRVHTISKFGSLVSSIEQEIIEHKIDVVLMGTKGSKGMEKILFGSNASEVVRGIEIPVAVVPSKYEVKRIRKIVLAINGYEKVQPESLKILKSILHDHGIEIGILTVVREKLSGNSEENRALVVRELKNYNFSSFTTRDDDISESINRFSNEFGADLIALLPHKYNVVKHLFHHSISKDLASRANIPVLALR